MEKSLYKHSCAQVSIAPAETAGILMWQSGLNTRNVIQTILKFSQYTSVPPE